MAKPRFSEQNGPRSNSHLRILFVELNGADSTIEEALRTVERIRRSPEIPQQPIKQIVNPLNASDEAPATPSDATTSESPEADGDLFNNRDAETEAGRLRQKRGEGQKVDRNAGIKLVLNLDFVPKDKLALKTFFAEKVPVSDMDKILVICHYLERVLNLQTYGPGHILTGLKHVATPVPVDLKGTIRNMKNNKAWLNFSDLESIRVTTEGDNRVEHELGKNTDSI